MDRIGFLGGVFALMAATAVGEPYRITVAPSNEVAEVLGRILELDEAARQDGVEVVFEPGDYGFDSSICLEGGHSGRPGAEVVFRAKEAGSVRFVGGVPLDPSAFAPVPDGRVRDRLKKSVRDRVLVCDIAPYLKGPLAPWPDATKVPPGPWLYIDDEPATMARYPDEGWIRFGIAARTGFENANGGKAGPGAFYWEGDAEQVKSWHPIDGVWLYGYWTHDWSEEFLRMDSLEETATNLVINLKGTHAYGIAGHKTYGAKKRRYFVLNLPEELDAPGEFWIDRTERKLYLLPPKDLWQKRLNLAILDRPFFQTMCDCAVHDVRFEDLTFTFAHALEYAVELSATRVTFKNCKFSNLGGNGVSLRGCGNRLESCRIRNLGATGVMLDGGDATVLKCAGNAVIGCEISHYACFSRTYCPALRLDGVGQVVIGNCIHDAPHQAIYYKGQCHEIVSNVIYRVLTDTADSGAIYAGRRTDVLGTVIAHNHFHDLAKNDAELRRYTYAVYFDDCEWGTNVFSNRFERLGTGVLVGGGNLHRIEGNFFEDCACGITCGSRGRTWPMFRPDPVTGTSWFERWLIPHDYKTGAWKERFPELEGLIADRPDLPRMNPIVGNAFVNCDLPMKFDKLAQSVTNEMPVAGNVIIRCPAR